MKASRRICDEGLTEETFDVEDYLRRIERWPTPAGRLYNGAVMLIRAFGWRDKAMRVLHRCVELVPEHAEGCFELGTCYAERGRARRKDGAPGWRDDLQNARTYLRRVVLLEPNHRPARENLRIVNALLLEAARAQTAPR